MSVVLAHAGHWAVNVLYVVPLLFAVVILTRQTLRDRRIAREAGEAGEVPDGEAAAPPEPPPVR